MSDFRLTAGNGLMMSWRGRAKCASLSVSRADELFFADGKHPDTVEHAKLFCASCPVKVQCAAWGAAINAEFGVYGGVPAYARKSLISLYRDQHPDIDTAALSEAERFACFSQWIEQNPYVIAQAIGLASKKHNRAYWRRKRSDGSAGSERSLHVPVAGGVPDVKDSVQLTLF